MNMEMFQRAAVGFIAFVAVLTDLRWKRIPNTLIFGGLILGMTWQLLKWGLSGSLIFLGGTGIPILLLGSLYYFRMLGAGEVKLFAVLGGFLGARGIFSCILAAFLVGGVLSLLLMVVRGNLVKRFWYFRNYVTAAFGGQSWRPYRSVKERDGEFCFSIPVFISVMCWIGGII